MNPVVIEDSIAVAANTVNENVINSNNSLKVFLNAPFAAQGRFLGVISATGLRVDVGYGANNVISSSDLRVDTTFQDPNDVINEDFFIPEGAQVFIRAANTTGGSITLRYRYELFSLADAGVTVLPPDLLVMQRGPVAVANNTTDQQLLDGLQYEQPPQDCIMDILMTASAAGLTRQVYIETQRLAPPSSVAALNRVPTKPFDTILTGIQVQANRKVSIPVSNASGGSLNAFWRTEMQQLRRAA